MYWCKMKQLYFFLLLLCYVAGVRAQTISLDSCLNLAMNNNLQIRNAELEIEKARQVKYQALTKYFPNIRIQALGFHALDPLIELGMQDIINGISDQQTQSKLNKLYQDYGDNVNLEKMFGFFQYGVTAGAVALQPVFAGGQIINGNRLAKLGIDAARLQTQITQRDIKQDVEQTYLLIVGLEAKKTTLQSVIQLLDTLNRNVVIAIAAGLTTNNDLLKIQLKRNETEQQQLQLENGLTLAKQALCTQIGLPYSDSLKVDSMYVFNFISDNLTRPEYELLELNVRAEQLKMKMEIGKSLPQIAVGGTYSYNRFFKDKNQHNGMLFATIQVPLTGWWETGHKIKELNLTHQQAENNRQYLSEQMELQSVQAQHEVLVAKKQIIIAEKTVDNAQENLRITMINYEVGLLPISDVLEAQTMFIKAKNDLIDARLQLRLAERKANDYN